MKIDLTLVLCLRPCMKIDSTLENTVFEEFYSNDNILVREVISVKDSVPLQRLILHLALVLEFQ